MHERYPVEVTVTFPSTAVYHLEAATGTRVSDFIMGLFYLYVPGGFPQGYSVGGWKSGPILPGQRTRYGLRMRSCLGMKFEPESILTEEVLGREHSFVIERYERFSRTPMAAARLYGCPQARDVVGVVPEGMLTSSGQLRSRSY